MHFRATKLRDTENPSKSESYIHTKIYKHALKFTEKRKQAKLEFSNTRLAQETESLRSKVTRKTGSLDCRHR